MEMEISNEIWNTGTAPRVCVRWCWCWCWCSGVSSPVSQPFPMRQMLMNPLLPSLLASLFVLFHNRRWVLRFVGHVTFDFYDVCRRPDRFRKCIDKRIFDIMGGDCIGYSSQLGLKRVNKPILQFEMDIFDYERDNGNVLLLSIVWNG